MKDFDYTLYNRINEWGYYYAPFTEQRRQLRIEWGRQEGEPDWNKYLYEAENLRKSTTT
jgi:hypothetical protein